MKIYTEIASQVNQCEQYRKSPLPATFGFVVIFIAERGLAFRDDENEIAQKVLQRHFQNFFQANIKKRRCDASTDWFCNSFTNC